MNGNVKLTENYCYLELPENSGGRQIVKCYKIGGIPYTFDEIPEFMQSDPEIQLDADTSNEYDMDEMYRYSCYLCEEEMHPLMWDLTGFVENFEEVPDA
tara:strand:- start:25790 stop:26086 length:297 start_codon:yes stop_codon:yes gene_type:complete